MALQSGTKLGAYEVISPLGEGGMGEVYRATDTNLKRQVAIKVLPAAMSTDPDRLARFQREAEVLATLNHPNIAHIYGLERRDPSTSSGQGAAFIVMELVDGPTLADRIANGPIPLDETLAIAKQLAEALEAAHEQGIIHRDLKPTNIKVREDGMVKVLDFGLAKALGPEGGGASGAGGLSMSPTLTTPAMMTGVGVILGTAAYMAPEQAKGRAADKRCDVWAFGCVLYEMLTARRAFDGEDMTDTIAAVVRGEPDWSALPADVPASIVTLIKRCLEKDRKARVSDIGVARFLMTETLPAPVASTHAAAPFASSTPRPLWRRAVPLAATAIVAGAVVAGAAWMFRPQTHVPPVVRFTLALGEGQQFTNLNTQSLSLSPDGTRIAYIANRQVYVRSLQDLEARPIAGTLAAEQSAPPNTPVFSPDGQSIVFVSQAERVIKRIAVTGGAAVTVCPAPAESVPGLSWDGGDVVFGAGRQGIQRVSANGGQPAVIAAVKTGEIAASPQMLPGGEWVLFTVASAPTAEGWDKAQIVAQSLKTSERKTLVSGGSEGRYLPSGHIVYALGGVLFAVPFDVRRLAVTGGTVSVVEGVRRSVGAIGTAYYAISASGSLAFIPGPVTTTAGSSDLALIDRATGAEQSLKLPTARYEHPRLSPDGKWIAVASDDGKDAIVWIHDVSGIASIRRLTLSGRNRFPLWSPDGQYVTFQSDREGDLAIWRQRADGTAPAERLTKPEKDTSHLPESWSPDGKTLLFSVGKGASFTAAALSMPDRKVTSVGGLQSSILFSAAFSPDGKWIAYEAREASTPPTSPLSPLFVQPFPPTGATYQIARNGVHATWSPNGKELFYGPAPGQVLGVTVTTRPAFSFSNPVPVAVRFIDSGPAIERNNDITPDGRKFLAVTASGIATSGAAPLIQVVLNWAEELKQRVPTK
jgi:eukaryotic-like serine/threonine-protein kinase